MDHRHKLGALLTLRHRGQQGFDDDADRLDGNVFGTVYLRCASDDLPAASERTDADVHEHHRDWRQHGVDGSITNGALRFGHVVHVRVVELAKLQHRGVREYDEQSKYLTDSVCRCGNSRRHTGLAFHIRRGTAFGD